MKIAIASHGIFPDAKGGMERHTYHLAECLKEAGHDVHVLVPLKNQEHPYPFPVHDITWPKKPLWLLGNKAFSKHCWNWVQENQADIAFGQGFAFWQKPSDENTPTIFHPHGLEMYGGYMTFAERLKSIPFRYLVETVGKTSDRVISLGGNLTKILTDRAQIPKHKIVEIPNAIDESRFPEMKDKMPGQFLFVGRLAFNKGIDFLEGVLANVQHPGFRLKIIGNGPLRPQVEALQKSHSKRVTYLPNASEEELQDSYLESEALLFVSRFEGMPTVILEAMLAECAILATDIGAVRVMVHPANGFLMEPNVEWISKTLNDYLKQPIEKRLELGKKGRETVLQNFTWNAVTKKYIELFENLKAA